MVDTTKPMRRKNDGLLVAHHHRTPNGHHVVDYSNGQWDACKNDETFNDYIENIPEERTLDMYINVYPYGPGCTFPTRERADKETAYRDANRIACLRIVHKYTVGEGL